MYIIKVKMSFTIIINRVPKTIMICIAVKTLIILNLSKAAPIIKAKIKTAEYVIVISLDDSASLSAD